MSRRRARSFVPRWAIVMLSAMGATAGCASETPNASATNAVSAVATAYMAALMSGDFEKAAAHVVSEQRDLIRALGISPTSTPRGMSGEVSIGKVEISQAAAVVVFVGQLCPPHGNALAMDCDTNSDRETTNPVFRLDLRLDADGWLVSLPFAQAGQIGAP